MKTARAVILLSVFLLMLVLMFPSQWLALWLDRKGVARTLPTVFHRVLCRVLGIRVHVHGAMAPDVPLLIVANHTSWLDIPIMSVIEPVSFVAKSEVESWPFFGLLAALQRTVYVVRGKRHQTDRQRDALKRRFADGDRLILFPEGTSGDGNSVLPFNSALFGAAEGEVETADGPKAVVVQPMTLAYSRFYGLPMGRRLRPKFAWYGDMDLLPHFWGVFASGPLDVDLIFHRPRTVAEAGNRKILARQCQEEIAAGLALALAGKPIVVAEAASGTDIASKDVKSASVPAETGLAGAAGPM